MALTGLAVSLIPLYLVGAAIYLYFASSQQQNQRAQLADLAHNRSDAVELFLAERTAMLEALVETADLERMMLPGELEKVLDILNRRQHSFVDLGILDADGHHLAATFKGANTRVWAIPEGREVITIPTWGYEPKFSPDGRYLVYCRLSRVFDLVEENAADISATRSAGNSAAAFDYSGAILAIGQRVSLRPWMTSTGASTPAACVMGEAGTRWSFGPPGGPPNTARSYALRDSFSSS